VACMGEMKSVYRILVEKLEGKRPLRTHRCRWEGIRLDHREIDVCVCVCVWT